LATQGVAFNRALVVSLAPQSFFDIDDRTRFSAPGDLESAFKGIKVLRHSA
jgi:hypothetical protein